jgi:hypothetical protein
VRVRKECIDEVLCFISEKLRRDTVVLISVSACIAQIRVRCAWAGRSLRIFQPSEWLKNYCRKECVEVIS